MLELILAALVAYMIYQLYTVIRASETHSQMIMTSESSAPQGCILHENVSANSEPPEVPDRGKKCINAPISISSSGIPTVENSELPAEPGLLREMVIEEYRKMELDKIALPDYALSYAGAEIQDHSPTFEQGDRWSIFGVPLFDDTRQPQLVIEKTTLEVVPGVCWPFIGSKGFVTIELSYTINISAVSYEHASPKSLTEENLHSTPKNIEIWAGTNSEEMQLAGRLSFEIPPKGQVMFRLPKTMEARYMKFQVLDNYGSDQFTCLYRIRVFASE